MLFRCVVQRHAKRNARDATLACAFVALARHLPGQRDGCGARAARLSRLVLAIGRVLVIKISCIAKRKILFLWEI
jgi:hypothetical protein